MRQDRNTNAAIERRRRSQFDAQRHEAGRLILQVWRQQDAGPEIHEALVRLAMEIGAVRRRPDQTFFQAIQPALDRVEASFGELPRRLIGALRRISF